jgi:hypothetical protein
MVLKKAVGLVLVGILSWNVEMDSMYNLFSGNSAETKQD